MARKATERQRELLIENLSERVTDHEAPQAIIGDEFITVLLDMLLNLFESCIGSFGSKRTAKRVRKLGRFQQSQLRTKIRRNLFDNSRRKYNAEGGDDVFRALVKTAGDLSKKDANDVVTEVDDNRINYNPFF